MNRTGVALCCGLLLASACARIQPRPLHLPPRDAPLEQRVMAYHQHVAMPHGGWDGWALRMGDGPVRELAHDRPYLANAPEAEDGLHARDNRRALAWTLIGAGLGTALISLLILGISQSSDPSGFSVVPLAGVLSGALLTVPGVCVQADAEQRVPPAVEAYNRWLWRELDLPRAATAP